GGPVSSFVTSVSFVIYLICRLFGSARRKNAGRIPAHA
ncbi:MAG: metal ABC transporter permease, partial [Rhodococcus sp. (in: high G+C Gram-positive bacteria)]